VLPTLAASDLRFQPAPLDEDRARVSPRSAFAVRAFAALCLVSGAGACAHVAPPSTTQELTVGAWNILHDDRDLPFVVETLAARAPDLVLLSEVTETARVVLDDGLAPLYPTRVFFDELALLTRLPVVDVREHAPVGDGKAQLHATIAVEGALIDVALVHFVAPHVDDPTPAGVWQTLDAAERVHEGELRRAVLGLDDRLPRLVVGDMNTLPFDGTRARALRRGYRDVAAELAAFPASTWRGPLFGVDVPLRIDYVYVSEEFTPLSLDVTETHASDHALLVARLALRVPDDQGRARPRAHPSTKGAKKPVSDRGDPARTRSR